MAEPRYSEKELEDLYIEITAKITGANALSDYEDGRYDTLPELLVEYFNNISGRGSFYRVVNKIKEIEALLVDLREKIYVNYARVTHKEDETWK